MFLFIFVFIFIFIYIYILYIYIHTDVNPLGFEVVRKDIVLVMSGLRFLWPQLCAPVQQGRIVEAFAGLGSDAIPLLTDWLKGKSTGNHRFYHQI